MSGFFGIFRPQGGPVDLEAFEQMKIAMHRDGFDGMETHVEEKIAMGHLMLRVSPESIYDKQPLKSSCGNYILMGHFRLDYRDELGDKLGLRQSELEVTPDSHLAMLAYQKWKEKCVRYLEGDWAFVLYQKEKNSFSLFRDPIGFSALFYFHHIDEVYFFSDIKYLLNVKKINLQIDFRQMLRISIDMVLPEKTKTLFVNLHIFEHAHFATFDQWLNYWSDQYWSFSIGEKIRFRLEEDYSLQLFSLIQESVKSKFIHGVKSGIFLSSGFDSTSICYILDKIAKKFNCNIHSYTACPKYLNLFRVDQLSIVNEAPYVSEYLNQCTSIKPNYCNSAQSEIDFLANVDQNYYYPIATPNTFWIDEIFNEAKKNGVRRMFNAQLGNLTISNKYPSHLYHLLLRLKLLTFRFEFLKYKRANHISIISVIKQYIIQNFKKDLKSLLRSKKKSVLSEISESIFSVNMFKKFKVFEQLAEEVHNSRKVKFDEFTERKIVFDKIINNATVNWYNFSSNSNIEIIDPTSDLRILNFSLSIPPKLFNLNGEFSHLFKLTFRGKLPDSILNLKFSRLQSLDIAYRLKDSSQIPYTINKFLKIFGDNNTDLELMKLNENFEIICSGKSLFKRYNSSRLVLKQLSLLKFLEKFDKR
jgi:asparagine synthase (glutamine-hydrolysing)